MRTIRADNSPEWISRSLCVWPEIAVKQRINQSVSEIDIGFIREIGSA